MLNNELFFSWKISNELFYINTYINVCHKIFFWNLRADVNSSSQLVYIVHKKKKDIESWYALISWFGNQQPSYRLQNNTEFTIVIMVII